MNVSAVTPHRNSRVIGNDERFPPAMMVEVELTESLPRLSYDGQHELAWVLARLHGEPVGTCVIRLDQPGLSPDELGALLWTELSEPVTVRFGQAGLPVPTMLSGDGLVADAATWPFLLRRHAVLAKAPFISVVLCTRDRVDQVERCLRHLDQQEYPAYEVVVVDNAPTSDAVRTTVERHDGHVDYHYTVEPRGGLSWARNAGVAAASGEIIAFLDDDEEPDRYWLAGIAGGFDRGSDIGCVTGMIAPARLDTPVQWWFELAGGHSKGRGFTHAIFSPEGPQSPLYPLPAFGAGGNMAFRREVLKQIGGFDVALGTGTPARAAEDTLALTLVMLGGYRIAYEPSALIHHDHYSGMDGLARQLHGYGVGLTAYYAALLRHRPSVLPRLLKLLPAAVGYMRHASDTDGLELPELPAAFRRQKRWGMLAGPVAYIKSSYMQSKLGTG